MPMKLMRTPMPTTVANLTAVGMSFMIRSESLVTANRAMTMDAMRQQVSATSGFRFGPLSTRPYTR